MANEENTNEEAVEVVKDTTPFSWDDVPKGGGFALLPEATLEGHIVGITIERDVPDNRTEGKVFMGIKFFARIDFAANLENGNIAEDELGDISKDEVVVVPLNGSFHYNLTFNSDSHFMKNCKTITQNAKLDENMIKEQGEAEFFNSLLLKPLYLDIVHKKGTGKNADKTFANVGGITKAVKRPSLELEGFELNEKFTKNQCAVFSA